MAGPIIVGVDGSPESRRALDLAVDEARLRDLRVQAIHAWTLPQYVGPPQYVGAVVSRGDQEAAAQAVLDEALADVPADVDVEDLVWEGRAAATLTLILQMGEGLVGPVP